MINLITSCHVIVYSLSVAISKSSQDFGKPNKQLNSDCRHIHMTQSKQFLNKRPILVVYECKFRVDVHVYKETNI